MYSYYNLYIRGILVITYDSMTKGDSSDMCAYWLNTIPMCDLLAFKSPCHMIPCNHLCSRFNHESKCSCSPYLCLNSWPIWEYLWDTTLTNMLINCCYYYIFLWFLTNFLAGEVDGSHETPLLFKQPHYQCG